MASSRPSRDAAGAILLSTDLLFSSQASAAADRAEAKLAIVARSEDLLERVQNDSPGLVLVDLQMPGLEIEDLVGQLRASAKPPSIIAYAPHVREALLAAAQDAGCDEVLTRGQIHRTLEAILKQRLNQEETPEEST